MPFADRVEAVDGEVLQHFLGSVRPQDQRSIQQVVTAQSKMKSQVSLRMPPRSLQRRLQAEGLSFRGLLDEWRRARALSLVNNSRLPLSEVSEALGYSEQSVFTHAFRRWYGGTPHRFRKQRPAAGA